MILNDTEIAKLVEGQNMIEHYVPSTMEKGRISYGITSFGYDMRLGKRFYFPKRNEWNLPKTHSIDPKEVAEWDECYTEKMITEPFYIPEYTFILAVSVEKFNLPDDVWGMVVGKSTYARCGIFLNTTPMEPAWSGYLTLEIFNASNHPVKLYVGEGIAQVSFFRGNAPKINYRNKNGKYQNQPSSPVRPLTKR